MLVGLHYIHLHLSNLLFVCSGNSETLCLQEQIRFLVSVMGGEQPPDLPEGFPKLEVPPGLADVFCKYCRRSKYTTINTILSPQFAIETNQTTLRWRRERGNQCAPCLAFQSRKSTKTKFKPHNVTRLWFLLSIFQSNSKQPLN